jgi:hypothetical protein
MISKTLPKSANLCAAIILLAGVAATPGFTQSRFGADADRQQEIVERIALEETRSGPYSEDLIAPLSDLALLYQDRGDHELAVAVIARVRQVVRANEGLHSLEQIPLLQQLIANEEVLGRLETAKELEQELLTLAKRHPDDMRTVPVFRETAAKRMTLLRQYLAGEFPPQMVLGCYYGWPRGDVYRGSINRESTSCHAGNRNDAIRTILADAQTNYADAIAVMLRNGLYSSDELQNLELELVRSIDVIRDGGAHDKRFRDDGLTAARLDLEPWRSWWDAVRPLAEWELAQPPASFEQGEQPAGQHKPLEPASELGQVTHPSAELVDYGFGRRSLERLLAYENATSAPLPEQIAALVRVADWDLLYSYNSRALEQYERAHELLKQAGAQASIDELFAPIIPVVLPTFVPNPLASYATEASTGYIDVAFEVGRYGDIRRIEILDTTMDATDADKTHLVQLIQRSRFRPRLTDGELARASPVVLRYYLTE